MRVSAADKLHNARAIVSDLRGKGKAVWNRFNVSTEDQIWYYEEIVTALRTGWTHKIVDELEQVVVQLGQLESKKSYEHALER